MSSQRGNVSRKRKQKYCNSNAFKNDLHDKSQKTKTINNLTIEGVCKRCKEKIEWKIKYKKYKPLTQPATCIRCKGKTIKRAYYIVCQPCATQAGVCAKCNTKQEIVIQPGLSDQEKMAQDDQLKSELQHLTERQRRSFFRHVGKGDLGGAKGGSGDVDESTDSSAEDEEDDIGECKDDITSDKPEDNEEEEETGL